MDRVYIQGHVNQPGDKEQEENQGVNDINRQWGLLAEQDENENANEDQEENEIEIEIEENPNAQWDLLAAQNAQNIQWDLWPDE